MKFLSHKLNITLKIDTFRGIYFFVFYFIGIIYLLYTNMIDEYGNVYLYYSRKYMEKSLEPSRFTVIAEVFK